MSPFRPFAAHALALVSLLAAACDGRDAGKDAAPESAKTQTKADEVEKDEVGADAPRAGAMKVDAKAEPEAVEVAEADEAAAGRGPAPAEVPIAAVAPGKPGPAYFAVHDKGVVMLDGGTFTPVDAGTIDLSKFVREIGRGLDGKVYLLGLRGVMQLRGAKATMVAETELGGSTGTLEAFAVTKDGDVWAVGYKGVSHWDGTRWTTEDKQVLGHGVTLVRGVAVDGRGRIWVASANGLHLRQADAWTDVDVSKSFERKALFQNIAVGPEGIAYAVASDTVLEIRGPDAVKTIEVGKKFAMLGDLAFSTTGVGGLQTSVDRVTRIMPDGNRTTFEAGKDFAADRIEDVSIDDSGRLCIATDAGVAILGPTDERVEWKSGRIDALAGPIDVIGVVGSGPELPSEVGPVKTGRLRGRIVRGGAGVADTKVEICPKPNSFFETSPCDESPTRRSATTDAEGNFEILDVPLGAYGLAVRVDEKKWTVTFGSEYGADMKEGQVDDIGSISLQDD